MNTSKILFNADDFGMSSGINKGILYAYQHGVVNSSSVMVNMPFFEEAVGLIHQHNLERIGLHVNLTEGKSVLKTHTSLTDTDASFKKNIMTSTRICQNEVYREIEAQYLKAKGSGITITHIDSHLHLHMEYTFQLPFLKFSKKYGIPLRRINFYFKYINLRLLYPTSLISSWKSYLHEPYYSTHFSSAFFGEQVNKQFLFNLLQKNKHKELEIMCHPGYQDPDNGGYNEKREMELQLLCDPEIVSFVK